jgi:PAS domain S-box-containing protein
LVYAPGDKDRTEVRTFQPSAVGPLFHSDRIVVRYGAAVLFVVAIFALRVLLTPIMGTQAPLLPFILAVLGAGVIGGFGPAMLATLLVPLLAALHFGDWTYGSDGVAWVGHVSFFVVIGISVASILHRLQRAVREQQHAVTLARAAEAKATASDAQIRLIADGAPVLICYVSADRVFQFANANYAAWFKRPITDIVGRHVREVLGEEYYAKVSANIGRALAGQRVGHSSVMSLPSGPRHLSVHYVPDFAPDGAVRGFVELIEDVTERVRADEALRANARQRDQFLAMLAHELRNPLQNIRFATDLLRNHDADLAMVRRNVNVVHKHTAVLTRLVDELLDVTRITHGTVTLRRQPISINFVLRAALDSVRPIFSAKQQAINESLCEEMVIVDADPMRLSQAIANVLTNAAQYSPAGSVVSVTTERLQDEVIVRIADEGEGIAPEELPHVFDLFMRTNHAFRANDSGVGIGLTIAKHLVELHGGRISAHSDGVGKGSIFEIRLHAVPNVATSARPSDATETQSRPDNLPVL